MGSLGVVVSIWSLGTDGGRGGDSGVLVWFLIRLKRVLESVLVFAALL